MSLRRLIRQERRAHRETLVGTVLTDMVRETCDGVRDVFVVDVDVGSRRILKDVVVKGDVNGERSYARRGQTVVLRRNMQNRYDVVAPGDRVAPSGVLNEYVVGNSTPTTTTNFGFTITPRSFDFYEGAVRMTGYPAITFAAATITRAAGSWVADGFLAGGVVRTARATGDANHNVTRTILTVGSTVLTMTVSTYTAGGPFTGYAVAQNAVSRWADGATLFPKVSVIDNATGLEVP